jgi:type IV secretory pathway TrbD component
MVAPRHAALLSPLLVGLVDPNARTWILPVNGTRVWLEEHRYAVFQVLSVLPCNQIPE